MKKTGRLVIGILFVIAIIFLSYSAVRQDPLEVNPNIKILFENERVRVLDERSQPGQKEEMHNHPDRIIYTLSSYKIKLIAPDGTATVREAKADEVFWVPASRHGAENIGTTELHVLSIELKEPPLNKRKRAETSLVAY